MRPLALAIVVGLALGGCGRAQGMADTRRALEAAGYREVDLSLRTGGGLGVARVGTAPGGPPAARAAEVAWGTLPVRFDQLVVAVGPQTESFAYLDLAGRFGPRDSSLDRKQIDEEVVADGVRLMVLLSVAAMLSVGLVVALGLAVLRTARRVRRQAVGPGSGLGSGLVAPSPTAGVSDAEGTEAIPS